MVNHHTHQLPGQRITHEVTDAQDAEHGPIRRMKQPPNHFEEILINPAHDSDWVRRLPNQAIREDRNEAWWW